MEKDIENVVVALAADQNYFAGLLVTAGSIARNASKSACILWVILDGGVKNDDIDFLERTIQKVHNRSLFQRVNFTDGSTKQAVRYKGSIMPYARLFLPRLLPEHEFVIYCDVDFLWKADVVELWKLRSKDFVLQSTLDECISVNGWKTEDEWATQNGFNFDRSKYFCSGLCLFNLKKIRERHFDERFFEMLYLYPDVPLADQTIMNLVVPKNEIGWLPLMWQRLVCELTREKISLPIVLHYAGAAPWKSVNTKLLSDIILAWFQEYALLCNVSLKESVSRVHSAAFAIFSRFVFLVATSCKFSLRLFRCALRLIGHEGYMPFCFRAPELLESK